MIINDDEFEIFSRQLILKEFDEKSFLKLQNKKISIIGLGGIGCPLSQYLICNGLKKLNLFDNDVIKKNNLNRQTLYNINDIGKNKSNIAKNKLLKINPNAKIVSNNKKITKNNLFLLDKSSLIIDATDNWSTMRLVNKYSLKKNIPLISASAVGYDIQIALFENKKNKHLCLECLFPNKKEPDLSRCDTVGILGSVAGLAGILSAQKTINYFMNFNKENVLTLINCKTLSINNIKIERDINCKLQ